MRAERLYSYGFSVKTITREFYKSIGRYPDHVAKCDKSLETIYTCDEEVIDAGCCAQSRECLPFWTLDGVSIASKSYGETSFTAIEMCTTIFREINYQ